ncbi:MULTISPECIES: methylenetetrahydrofolate reductase C-terminal domain-containing protein [unclassified Pseudomonas]|uniref:methylenetetrahydrofolate reductase C-terminal domain-containing protein n=1 Tax=unclassified Pseudomonas TaxID=196821 RepID=UPI001EE05821|nr:MULTISPECIES: methylenetetrahydrofolate reductase C-terminal domain-containing protein [unclassified Pseudomonas]MCG4452847.1 methylenetetrahydrofolate reductase C-terminal domain-containing protein [Pseudomonas sp. MMS21 TM103]
MYKVRRWVVRHSRLFESLYLHFEPLLVKLHPLWRRLGYARVEGPMRVVEKGVKGLLFDCQMCGKCVLSSTGMSCPMNCPKTLRNGPCGGVRSNGHCEVKPEMKCVWVEAWSGSRNMREGERIHVVQQPVDYRLKGTSSWLSVVRQQVQEDNRGDQ